MSALDLAEIIDLSDVRTCPLCLLELAQAIRDRKRASPSLVARTTDWVWLESGNAIRTAVVRARMREITAAEEALRALDAEGHRSAFARAVVYRLACALAVELA